jgi:ferritin-like metal-binding protein YciE
MTLQTFQDLYVEQLRDLYSAETQLLEALPKMIEQASDAELRSGFQQHLEETRNQQERLVTILRSLDKDPDGHTCAAMKGLIKEANEFISDTHGVLSEDTPRAVRDAGLIAAAQRVEHYEIAAYGTVCEYAKALGRSQDLALLKQSIAEEKATDEKLTRIAEGWINQAAVQAQPTESGSTLI